MATLRQHIPSFVEGFEPKVAELSTVEDLNSIDWVRQHREDPEFYRFSLSDRLLMAEFENGDRWWVVGILSEPLPGLPDWKMTVAGEERVHAWNRGEVS